MRTHVFARRALLGACALALPAVARAQVPTSATTPTMASNPSVLAAGFGMTSVNGHQYFLFNTSPEFNLGMVGVGLDVNLRFDPDSGGKLRKEDWRTASDVLKAVRYVRYGSKEAGTPVYVRAGELTQSTLGYGQVMYLYDNSPSYDARKRGAEVGLDFGMFGVEGIYSNFAKAEVTGGRAYVRPLKSLGMPLLSRLEVGGTAAMDLSPNAGIDLNGVDHGHPTVYGGDIGLPVLANALARVTLYGDMAKIKDGGNGEAIGTQLSFNGLGMAHLAARLEHRMMTDHYVPSFFDSHYEIDRYQLQGCPNCNAQLPPMTRYGMALASQAQGQGMYGELAADVLNVLTATGSYQRLYSAPNSGMLHIDLGTGDKIPMLVVKGRYDKWAIGKETGIFKLDDHSLAELETGYKPNRFMTVSLVTQWTFAPMRDGSDNIIGYQTQKRIEPKITFGYSF